MSLFFIDEVEHYKTYDAAGQPQNGIFADMFEEEYADIISNLQLSLEDGGEHDYISYLNMISPSATHAGYFSIDKKGRMTNKELLLDRNPNVMMYTISMF